VDLNPVFAILDQNNVVINLVVGSHNDDELAIPTDQGCTLVQISRNGVLMGSSATLGQIFLIEKKSDTLPFIEVSAIRQDLWET